MSLPPDDHRLRPDHLPTPFSAAEIRHGCPPGRTIRVREETPEQPPSFRIVRFVEVDGDGAVQEFQTIDPEGRPMGEPSRRRSTWLELQRHASQPADATTVEEATLALPFGSGAFTCWLYTVRAPDAERRFWFAKELPGMPVQVEEWSGGALAGRSTMIASETQPPG